MELTVNEKLVTYIENLEDEFLKVQVSRDIKFSQEAYYAIQILERNKYTLDIARGNPSSLRNSIINVATIGLSLQPSMGLAYLVPRKCEICLDISYLGLIKLAQEGGGILHVKADLVYEKDNFTINGSFSEPTHSYSPFGDRGELKGAYVVALTSDGNYLTTIMPINEVFEIRNASESYKNPKSREYSPWVRFEGEMVKKTVIRRAFKSWPKININPVLEKAIQVSDEAQAIEFKQVETEFQKEQRETEEDFPIPEHEKVIGSPDYRILYGAKYKNKQLKEIDIEELSDYLGMIEKRHMKHNPKHWEPEIKASIKEYLENYEMEASVL